ncbi:hypothetical protein EDC01DRAFT_517102 [Geopyxis carbonaria]|nr:hypothetical protein EDC01DRAFT_517102 [Geopyxis carbonaria]
MVPPPPPPPAGIDLSENRQGEWRGITVSVTILATIFVGLRFLARTRRGIGLGRDDYTLLAALVFLYADAGVNMALIHYGMGRHAAALPPHQLTLMLKGLVFHEFFYCTTVGVIKISLLLMYARIFTVRWFRTAAWIVGASVVGWTIAIQFVSIFQCTPIYKAWEPFTPGHCINLKASFIGNGVPNVITDFVILTLPMPVVWNLQASVAHRLSLSFIFLLGGFVVFASIYRFVTIFQFDPMDTSWTLATACTWCVVECAVGIVSACLPTLRPLITPFTSALNSAGPAPPSTGRDIVTIGGSELKGGSRKFSRLAEMRALRGTKDEHCVTVEADDADSVDREARGGDEVPLNAIRVREEVDLEWGPAEGGAKGAGTT